MAMVSANCLIAACAIDVRDSAARPWFVAALLLSFAGDVFLMLPTGRFVEGLGAFLLGHVAYVIGFVVAGITLVPAAVGAVLVAAAFVPAGIRILRSARAAAPELVAPVSVYMVIIGCMVSAAFGSKAVAAIIGAVLFAFSDSLIAWDRFVRPLRWAAVAIMVTYHLGQFGLLLSLAAKG